MRFKFFLIAFLGFSILVNAQPTLRDKIGQMLMVGFSGTTVPDSLSYDIQNRNLGGVVLFGANISSPNQLLSLTNQFQTLASNRLLISVDQEGGKVARLNQTNGFTSTNTAYKLGTIINLEDSTRQTAGMMAEWLKQTGFNVNLAPVADVNVNQNSPAIGKLERSFSKFPQQVADHAQWFIDEFQNKNIITTLKHFPGHGSAATDSHLGFTDVTTTWADSELIPYRNLIAQDKVDMIMIGHLFNSNIDSLHPASLSIETITRLLRDSLHYNGVAISDELFMNAISANYTLEDAVELCIKAGTDILLFNRSIYNSKSLVGYLIDVISLKVNLGIVSAALIDSAYNRIQLLKQKFITNIKLADGDIPNEFILYQNFPNPFNPTTKIRYSVPSDVKREKANVVLKVYDILGNEVTTLVDEYKSAGIYEVNFDPAARNLYPASGIYFYQLRIGDQAQTRKMILLR